MAEKATKTKATAPSVSAEEARINRFLHRKLNVLNQKGGKYLQTATRVQLNANDALRKVREGK